MNEDKKIVGIGYNGMPNGCSDDVLPWGKEATDKLDTKYPYGGLDTAAYMCTDNVFIVQCAMPSSMLF